jgi:ATP-dependent Clp protease adaptor protein ClpS
MSGSSTRTDRQILEKTRHKTARPSLYKVFLLNDDYTTMEFVVEILCEVFNKPHLEATRIMLFVHREGRGLAGIYPKDIAETKIETVHQRAQDRSFPLRCAMEKE